MKKWWFFLDGRRRHGIILLLFSPASPSISVSLVCAFLSLSIHISVECGVFISSAKRCHHFYLRGGRNQTGYMILRYLHTQSKHTTTAAAEANSNQSSYRQSKVQSIKHFFGFIFILQNILPNILVHTICLILVYKKLPRLRLINITTTYTWTPTSVSCITSFNSRCVYKSFYIYHYH